MDHVLNISEAANLALHAGMALALAQGRPVSARTMAAELKVSYHHLAKVLQRLAKAGLVEATRGPGGGFVLGKDPQRIRLLDLYEAIDGKFSVGTCLFKRQSCPGGKCVMGNLLERLNGQVLEHLKGKRLSDFSLAKSSQEPS